MSKCELAHICTFPVDFSNNLPAQLATIKRAYCNDDYRSCSRYHVYKALGCSMLANDLHPDDKDGADLLISSVPD